MKTALALLLLAALTLIGCKREATPVLVEQPAAGAASGRGGSAMVPGIGVTLPTPVPMADGVAQLSADNSAIVFVGTHTGDEPNPRTGSFGEFSGQVQTDPETDELKSIEVEIQTASLRTDIDKLTNHLKAPDFLDAREYPTITFRSTNVTKDADTPNIYQVTGELTLHGVTKEIQFSAKSTVQSDALLLNSEFTLDRTEFGMSENLDGVEKQVQLNVMVGQRTAAVQMTSTSMEDMDPLDRFRQHDTDGDGVLTGDEITDRMLENLEKIDTDDDGAVSQEEFQQGIKSAAN